MPLIGSLILANEDILQTIITLAAMHSSPSGIIHFRKLEGGVVS